MGGAAGTTAAGENEMVRAACDQFEPIQRSGAPAGVICVFNLKKRCD